MISNTVFFNNDSYEFVAEYLLTRDWQLLNATKLMTQLSDWFVEQGSSSQLKKPLQQSIWRVYGEVLHNHCCDPHASFHNRAWHELREWLMRRGSRSIQPSELENVVQETLIRLTVQLYKAPLADPRMIWAYAGRSLKTVEIDQARKFSAEKRGRAQTISLEQLQRNESEEESNWEERLAGFDNTHRQTEEIVTSADMDATLHTYLRQNLPTAQQQEIAIAHFLQGRRLKDIAAERNKPAYQIRLTKSRILKKLRHIQHQLPLAG
ncbi:MAG: hypothetical protein ACPG8W_18155 [Candidatus Promineifilaceae bacterium]